MRIPYSEIKVLRGQGLSFGKIAKTLTQELGVPVPKGSVYRAIKKQKDLRILPKGRAFPIWKYLKDPTLLYRLADHLALIFKEENSEALKDFILDFLYRQDLSEKLNTPFVNDNQAWSYLEKSAYGAITSHYLRLKSRKEKNYGEENWNSCLGWN